jgi:hypothetical protein
MYAEFDFPAPVRLDRVDLYCSHDQGKIDLKLEGIEAKIERFDNPPVGDLRRLATRTIKSRGIDYLLIVDEYQAAQDIAADPERWGLKLVATEGNARIYRIQ